MDTCLNWVKFHVKLWTCRLFARLIKEKKLICMVRYLLSEYDKTCIANTGILRIYKLYIFWVEEPHKGLLWCSFYFIIIYCQRYENNGQLQNSSYWLLITPIPRNSHKKQMTIPYKHTCRIVSFCMLHSELLFPRICTNSPQTSIEDEYP